MLLVIGAACLFAGGVWLIASAVWPAPQWPQEVRSI